jgi:hypothetical protein
LSLLKKDFVHIEPASFAGEYFSSIFNPYLHIQQRIFDFKVKISWKTHFTLKVAILTI